MRMLFRYLDEVMPYNEHVNRQLPVDVEEDGKGEFLSFVISFLHATDNDTATVTDILQVMLFLGGIRGIFFNSNFRQASTRSPRPSSHFASCASRSFLLR